MNKQCRSMLAGVALAVISAGPALAADAVKIASFGFSLDNTSLEPTSPAEIARTERISRDLASALQKSGRYTVVDTASAAGLLKGQTDIHTCNGCELPVARKVGAKLAAYGWVQKVSNLILNLNIVIEDAQSGRTVTGGSVDIRGNTDESWDHGLKFLLEEHVFPQ